MQTTREAFALRRCDNLSQIYACLVSLAIEASTNKPLDRRINTFQLQAINDQVINPELGPRDISTYYNEVTLFDKREKEAGLDFKKVVLAYPEGTVIVWISPPGGELDYQEGRIVVGVNKQGKMDVYGICTNFSGQDCLKIGKKLAEPQQDVLQDPEQLRGTTFILENLDNPWDFLKKNIPLEGVWENIVLGEVDKNKKQISMEAKMAIWALEPMLRHMSGLWQEIVFGAWLERFMMKLGHKLNSGECGKTNTELLSPQTSLGGEVKKFIRKCGQCGFAIGKVMTKGDQCPSCHGIWEARC